MACDSDRSVMKFYDFFYQRKPQTISFQGAGVIALIESVKDIMLCFFIHSDPIVFYSNFNELSIIFQ